MKKNCNCSADAFRIACSAVLAAVFFSTLLSAKPARVEAAGTVPGAGIGVSDGDRDGDGMIEGIAGDPLSDIGEGVSRGLEEMKDGAESLADGVFGGEGTEGMGRGPVETDPGVVRDNEPYSAPNTEKTTAENEPADTFWVVAAVVASVAAIVALAVAIPKRPVKKEDGQ
ncbi:MAG: hypothetical protein IKN50_07230 [Clostridia bacterium]|nr:hypothetical protein [Clostridia bacterium]MBR3640382.1 hypothetical protein [Clostridia bacterium]